MHRSYLTQAKSAVNNIETVHTVPNGWLPLSLSLLCWIVWWNVKIPGHTAPQILSIKCTKWRWPQSHANPSPEKKKEKTCTTAQLHNSSATLPSSPTFFAPWRRIHEIFLEISVRSSSPGFNLASLKCVASCKSKHRTLNVWMKFDEMMK